MNWYRCDICGCYLDPGEGKTCQDCLQEQKINSKIRGRVPVATDEDSNYQEVCAE